MDQWCGERLSQEGKTHRICKSKIWRPTARKAIPQVSPILDIWMSQKVESLVVCGWIENSHHNNGQYRRTTTAGIHQRIPTESIASPKETTPDGSTALFQCAEAPGRLKILGFSFSYYDIDHELDHCVEVSQIVTLLDANAKCARTKYQIHARALPNPNIHFPNTYCRHSVCLAWYTKLCFPWVSFTLSVWLISPNSSSIDIQTHILIIKHRRCSYST